MTILRIVSLILMCFLTLSIELDIVTVQGKLRGQMQEGFVSYGGIPYADISGAERRFKEASTAPSWTGVKDYHASQCSLTSDVSECLQLEVHVPVHGSAPWPVFVWVKGGQGSYHPGKIIEQGIIVVLVNHRLGPMGFLCADEDRIPGNAGVKDVVLALRWVRDNIIAFRGNSNKVVVGGQGFGAAMVEALLLSPMADGLFHGAILQSGTCLAPWAFNYDAQDRAKALAKMFGDSDDNISVLINANTADLLTKSETLNFSYFPFGICLDKPVKQEERLLPEPPYDCMKKMKMRDVPVIIGYNNDEAYIFALNLKSSNILKKITKDLTFLLPEELKFLSNVQLQNVVKQLKDMYFDRNYTMAAVLAYHRDAYFVSHIHRSVSLHASANHPVYYYQFSHSGNFGVEPEMGVPKTGAAHSDELAYLFPEKGRDLSGDDGLVQRSLVKLWTNFVKYLNPTPREAYASTQWDAVDRTNPRLLVIDTELRMQEFSHAAAARMWDDNYEKYYYNRQRGAK